jgi:hypothetical protein
MAVTKLGVWASIMDDTYGREVLNAGQHDAQKMQAYASELLSEWHALNREVELTYDALLDAGALHSHDMHVEVSAALDGKPVWLRNCVFVLAHGGDHTPILWREIRASGRH